MQVHLNHNCTWCCDCDNVKGFISLSMGSYPLCSRLFNVFIKCQWWLIMGHATQNKCLTLRAYNLYWCKKGRETSGKMGKLKRNNTELQRSQLVWNQRSYAGDGDK